MFSLKSFPRIVTYPFLKEMKKDRLAMYDILYYFLQQKVSILRIFKYLPLFSSPSKEYILPIHHIGNNGSNIYEKMNHYLAIFYSVEKWIYV